MKTRVCMVLIMLSVAIYGSAKQSSIVFRSKIETSLRIYKPIDNHYNFGALSKKLNIKANQNLNYGWDVDDFCSVRCEFGNGEICFALLIEGDSIEIDNTGYGIRFKGSNAAGNQYLHDNYWQKGLFFYLDKIERALQRHTGSSIDFKAFEAECRDSIQSVYTADIRQMEQSGRISHRFAEVLSQDLHNVCDFLFVFKYDKMLKSKGKEYKPSPSDSLIIRSKIEDLYQQNLKIHRPLSYDYPFPFEIYYTLKYAELDQTAKDNLLGNDGEDTFGGYASYLLAPDDIKRQLFGSRLIEQLQYHYNYFDAEKLFSYFKQHFPGSEYIKVIEGIMQEQKAQAQGKAVNKTILDSDKINSLRDFAQIPGLKGHYIYIDLWATWCMPCISEFKFKDELNGLLAKYGNIIPVYVSTDSKDKTDLWKKSIENFRLEGYNLRASEALMKELQTVIFANKSMLIPRYVLLDPTGAVVEGNLPRPSRLNLLEQALDKILKRR